MDKNDVQTLIHLIKSQSEQTRKELTGLFRTELKSQSEQTRKELRSEMSNMKSGLEFKIGQLEDKLDDKFEDHRRKIVDEIQTFENHMVKENLTLSQEMTVNSARITRIEKAIFPN